MKSLIILSCTTLLISGCLPTPVAEHQNTAPEISGDPQTTANIGEPYSFTVHAHDNDGDELSYIINNKPSWANFDEVTGKLSGNPTEVMISERIRIGVTDGTERSFLPTFDIEVTAVTDTQSGQVPSDPATPIDPTTPTDPIEPSDPENPSIPTEPSDPNSITNSAPNIANQIIEAVEGIETLITLGPEKDSDGDLITYSLSNSLNIQLGPNQNQATYLNTAIETETIIVTATDNIHAAVSATLTITVDASSPSNYITNRNVIEPNFGVSAPNKGESRLDPVTGAKITRITDASEMDGTSDALIVYSRYTPENSSGQYILSFGGNSTSAWVVDRHTTEVVTKLEHTGNKEIGEAHEIRWDTSGNYPNRVYYRYKMGLYMIEDISADTLQSTLIKDFTGLVPASATKIYNDVEGDSSNDNDHWAFMAAHYNGVTYVVDAFIHYQISTDTTHTLVPSDLTGTALDHYASGDTFIRPNMVEVSPLGTGIILHYGRSWGDANYGKRWEDIGTWFDGAHIWPLDFDHESQTPVKISIGETHSGWAFDKEGNELFISQNNRTDQLDAIYVNGPNAGYDNRIEMATHDDFGWSNGFHYGKMPPSKSGWVFISTYSKETNQYHDTDWGADQLILMELKPKSENPKVWRITPNYNLYDGNYRDEAPAAINLAGNRVYVSTNWGGTLTNREIFLFELPSNWNQVLED